MQEGTVRRSRIAGAIKVLSPIFWCCRPQVPIWNKAESIKFVSSNSGASVIRIVVHLHQGAGLVGELAGEIMIEAFRGKSCDLTVPWPPEEE